MQQAMMIQSLKLLLLSKNYFRIATKLKHTNDSQIALNILQNISVKVKKECIRDYMQYSAADNNTSINYTVVTVVTVRLEVSSIL